MWSSATTSVTPMRPPGTSTRNISASTASLSVDRLMTQLEMTTSTAPSGNGTASISPLRNSTLVASALMAFALARVSISSVMSTPYANPDGPTRRAESNTSMPPPEPRSRTRSPSFRSATASGLPQPRLARTASSGKTSVSSSRYSETPKTSAVSNAAEPVPQQEPELSQHCAVTPSVGSRTARAACAYLERTASRRLLLDWSAMMRLLMDRRLSMGPGLLTYRRLSMRIAYWAGAHD